MSSRRIRFSVCIPAYNRARHLPSLLNSIYVQDCKNFEVVICEDLSREREQIAAIAREYAEQHPGTLFYHENEVNLGYDGNIRRLVAQASGEFCFFMGNDDLLCPGALREVAGILARYPNVGMVLKSYAWFGEGPADIKEEIRYFAAERSFASGHDAIIACFRRSGVISGYIIHRDTAHAAATDKFDGTLYYQMHLTANVLAERCAVFTPTVLVLCRGGEPPDFGSSASEKGKFIPGHYTPAARLQMISGALSIVKELRDTRGIDVVDDVTHDYANYFYPYVKDQLNLPFVDFANLYSNFSRLGLGHYPMFHLYCVLGYVLGESNFDKIIRSVRQVLGKTPQFASTGRASRPTL